MSSSRCGTITGFGSSSSRPRRAIVSRSRRDEHVEVGQVVRRPPRERLAQLGRERASTSSAECPSRPCRWTRLTIVASHHPLPRRAAPRGTRASRAGSCSGEVTIRKLVVGVAQQLGDAADALAEAVDHARQRSEEGRELAEHVHAGDAREDREHEPGAAAEEARGEAARGRGTPSARGLRGSAACSRGLSGSRARCARAACRARSRRSRVLLYSSYSFVTAPSSCTPETADDSSR